MKHYMLGNSWEYEETDKLDDFGECDKLNRTIRIRRNQSKDQMIDTIFHELAHEVWELMGLPDKHKLEEKVCTAIGRGFGSLLRDPRNSDFIKYLIAFTEERNE